MKKLIYLIILISVVLTASCCDKDDDVKPSKPVIKTEQIFGDWKYQSIDGVALTCEQVASDPVLKTKAYVRFNLKLNVDETSILNDACNPNPKSVTFSFTTNDSILTWGRDAIKFKVLNVSTSKITLKCTYQNTTYFPNAGKTYVLTK